MKQKILLLLILTSTATMVFAQRQISGTVTDSYGDPLIGVTVSVKNTTIGTITDINGKYQISVPENAILSFSYIGYLAELVEVDTQSEIDVTLVEDITGLEEVVVIGYGTTRKKDLTGSVSSLSAEALEKRPLTSFEQGIQGNVAGVYVASSGGEPGSEMKIKMRGITSINSDNNPLIVVDGFPLSESSNDVGGAAPSGARLGGFGTINPNDIESMEFLKDASATAIYGSRGANGVILITTKRGRTGKPVISYDTYFGTKHVTKTIDVLDLMEYADYKHTITPADRLYTRRDANRTPIDYSNVESVDWTDEILRTGQVQNHSLSMQGGTEETKYLLSGSYYNEDAIIIENSYSKYNLKLSLDQKLWKNGRVGTDISYGLVSNDGIVSEGGFDSGSGLLTYALQATPLDNTDPDTWQFRLDSIDNRGIDDLLSGRYTFVTPKTYAEEAQNDVKNERLIANTFLEYFLLENLKLRVTGGFDINNVKNYRFYTKATPHGAFYDTKSLLGHIRSYSWLNENTLSYTKYWSNSTNLNIVGGFTQQFNSWEMFRVETGVFENETLGVNAIQVGLDVPHRPTSSISEYTMQSFLGRAAYNLLDKYLLTVSFRADGVSRFTEGNRWGYFPSAALAWRVSNEEFLQSFNWLNDLKFRFSYGSIGNSDVPASAAHSTLIPAEYSENNQIIPGYAPARMINKALSWETTNSTNVGLDLTVIKNRINLTVDYYDKTTVDVLLNAPIATLAGFNSVMRNIGKVQNKGVELALNSYIIDMPNLTWQFSFNFAKNENKVLELTNEGAPIQIGASPDGAYQDDYLIEEGQPIGNMYGFVWDGNYQESDFSEIDYENNVFVLKDDVPYRFGNERPGDIKFKDLNGDLEVTTDGDRQIIGNGQPEHFGGFSSTISYKGIDLFAGFNWSYGNDIYNYNLKRSANLTGGSNQLAEAWLDRWTPENPNNEHYARYLDQKPSSYWIEDGSFLRFQTARISYTIPQQIISKVRISELKINFTVDNVYVWTNYSGWDPEVSRSSQNLAIGMDYGAYPRARSFLLGVSVKL